MVLVKIMACDTSIDTFIHFKSSNVKVKVIL
jgi:hypothetical protein